MKYKCPKKEIREASWTRLPTPDNFFKCIELRDTLKAYDSDGRYWVNTIYSHFWIEKEQDASWMLMTMKL